MCNQSITCFAFHPQLNFIATGHENGMIKFWYCFIPTVQSHDSNTHPHDETQRPTESKQLKQQQQNVMIVSHHWHHERLHALTFDQEGHYMYSGGEEVSLLSHSFIHSFLPSEMRSFIHFSLSLFISFFFVHSFILSFSLSLCLFFLFLSLITTNTSL
jgi:hypothetical protein